MTSCHKVTWVWVFESQSKITNRAYSTCIWHSSSG